MFAFYLLSEKFVLRSILKQIKRGKKPLLALSFPSWDYTSCWYLHHIQLLALNKTKLTFVKTGQNKHEPKHSTD